MPFALLFVGLVILVSAYKGSQKDLANQLRDDFSGPNSFLYWLLGILTVGSIGYVKALEQISRAALGLILLVMFLTNGGVFDGILDAVNSAGTGRRGNSENRDAEIFEEKQNEENKKVIEEGAKDLPTPFKFGIDQLRRFLG